MPWIQLSQGASSLSIKTLELNYDSMLSPTAIFAALRNRHFLAAISTTVSLVLKITTVLASALLFIQEVSITLENVPLQVQDAFLPEMVPSQNTPDLLDGPSAIWT